MRCGALRPRPSAAAAAAAALRLLWLLSLARAAVAKEYKYTLDELQLTCFQARVPSKLAFCDMVDWVAATATPAANFSVSAAGQRLMPSSLAMRDGKRERWRVCG